MNELRRLLALPTPQKVTAYILRLRNIERAREWAIADVIYDIAPQDVPMINRTPKRL